MVIWANVGKALAAIGAAVSSLGVALPPTMKEKELIVAAGVFIVAIGTYLIGHDVVKVVKSEEKKNGGG